MIQQSEELKEIDPNLPYEKKFAQFVQQSLNQPQRTQRQSRNTSQDFNS